MYKIEKSYGDRKKEALNMTNKYTDRVPIIVEPKNNRIAQIDKRKYMVPKDLLFGQLIYVIRTRMRLSKDAALFVFAGSQIILASSIVGDVYEKFKDEDGFLYVVYDFENIFG